jgi:hypothetical protein
LNVCTSGQFKPLEQLENSSRWFWLVVAGAKLLFWNPRKSFFDMLPTTGPGYFSAG